MYIEIGHCLKCGAPIYSESSWSGITPPPSHYTCGCNLNNGNRNSGYFNSGNYNSGNLNSGYCNSGDWNIGDMNSGIFNTNEPKMRAFNKECDLTYIEFRKKYGFNDIYIPITKWIEEEKMTCEEKSKNPSYKTTGGYLRKLSYKDAWKEAWNDASDDIKNWYKSLPNFDAKIFEEITGIKID